MTKKILIAEDEEKIYSPLNIKLQNVGFETFVATSGEAALEALKKDTYDLILLDLIMPIVDGYYVLKELQRVSDQTPVIILSNLSKEDVTSRTVGYNVIDHFVKAHVTLDEVVQRINALFSDLDKGRQ